jgi:uncharacterized protein (TIGR02246 family)
MLAAALVIGAAWWLSAADRPAAPSADEQGVRAACEAYVKAVNAGDASAVAKLWAEDADYVNDSGEKFKGRTAIEKLFKDQLPNMKGKKFSFETQSLKMVAPGVALEDGIGKYTGGDDDEKQPGARYSAVWVRGADNKWLLSSVRDLGDLPTEGESPSPLKQLDWMVGDWQSSGGDATVDMSCVSAFEGKFLKQKYDVKTKEGVEFTVVTMVGWDPTRDQLRSWFFDSRGGFGDGFWSRDGNSWTISSNGVVADGRVGSATNIWKYVDENTIAWQSKDRELDGVPMPETEVKFVRKNAEAHK